MSMNSNEATQLDKPEYVRRNWIVDVLINKPQLDTFGDKQNRIYFWKEKAWVS